MLDAIIVSLTVSAVTALSWLAYKNPTEFRRLFWFFSIGLSLIFVVIVSLNFGIIRGCITSLNKDLKLFPNQNLKESAYVITSANSAVEMITTTFLVIIGIWLYLNFLFYLPKIIKGHEE